MAALTALASVVVGAILLAIGLRGWRIDRHPLCRRCGYDLSGNEDGPSCPECGRPLLGDRAVRVGHRRREPILIALGLIIALVGGGGGGALLLTQTTPNDVKPVWLLAWEMEHRGTGAGRAAFDELMGRLTASALSQDELGRFATACLTWAYDLDRPWAPEWETVIALAPVPIDPDGRAPHTIAVVMLKQAQWDVPWRPDLGDRVEWLRMNGFVSDTIWATYLRQSVESAYAFTAPARIRPSTRLEITYRREAPRVGTLFAIRWAMNPPPPRWRVAMATDPPRVDGGSIDPSPPSEGARYSWLDQASASGSTARPHLLTPGAYEIELSVRFTIARQIAESGPLPGPLDPDAGSETTEITSWERTYRLPIEIVPDSVRLVELVEDPDRAEGVRAALSLRVRRGDEERRRRFDRRLAINVAEAPLDVAFDVLLRRDERELSVGRLAVVRGATAELSTEWPDADWLQTLDRADVVFRPDVPAAEQDGLTSIWSGEVILPDVCLKRTAFRDAPPAERRDRFREIIEVHDPVVIERREDLVRCVLAITFRDLPVRMNHRVTARLGERSVPLDIVSGNRGDWGYAIAEVELDRAEPPRTFALELTPVASIDPNAPADAWPDVFTIPDIRLPTWVER